MRQEEDHIIARLSDAELLYWRECFGLERLSDSQRRRIQELDREGRTGVRSELTPPPRRLSPEEWAAVHKLDKETGGRGDLKSEAKKAG